MTECPVCKSQPKFVQYEKITIGHCPNWCKLAGIRQNFVVGASKSAEKAWEKMITKYFTKKHGSQEARFLRLYGREEFKKSYGTAPEQLI